MTTQPSPEFLDELDQESVLEYMDQTIQKFASGRNQDKFLGFAACCRACEVSYSAFRTTRKKLPEFDLQCQRYEYEIRQLLLERGLAEAMRTEKLGDFTKFAERVVDEIKPSEKSNQGGQGLNLTLNAIVNSSSPEALSRLGIETSEAVRQLSEMIEGRENLITHILEGQSANTQPIDTHAEIVDE